MNEKILMVLEGIKKRPFMHYSDLTTIKGLKAYLVGFVNGIEIISEVCLSDKLFYWLREKTGIDYDIVWDEIICDYNKDKTEDELKAALLETLQDFFTENPNWNVS